MYVLIRPQGACAGVILAKKPRKNEPPKKCISPCELKEDATIKIEMGIEGKNFFDAQSILTRRKLLFTASAAVGVPVGATIASRLLTPRAQTAVLPRETSLGLVPRNARVSTFVTNERIHRLRDEYVQANLFHEDTRVLFGSDRDSDGMPQFQTRNATNSIATHVPSAEIVSGFPENDPTQKSEPTRDSLLRAKEQILTWVRSTRRPISLLISAHGAESNGVVETISLGRYKGTDGASEIVELSPDELAGAYARRYKSMRARMQAREKPDVIAFINCGAGSLASNFLSSLEQKERSQESRRFLHAFKPTAPLTIAAGTDQETTYVNQLLHAMLQHKTVGELYPYLEFVGTTEQHSNPMLYVPDVRTGQPVIIGSREETSRFA
jgi:hypothetical protein